MSILKRIFKKNEEGENVPELKGTTYRTKYGKQWGTRHVALHGLGINVDLCKSDEFFERIMGVSPTTYLVYRAQRKILESFSADYNYVCIYFENKNFMRFINKVNFTFVMDVKKQKGKGYHGNVVNGFKKLEAYVNS
jgi:hypothetical protein